jgi:hypothetical protein
LRGLAGLLLILVFGMALAGEEIRDLESLMAALARVEEVRADYTETIESSLLATAISTRGHLVYRAPDQILKTGEHGEEVEISGDRVRVTQGGDAREIAIQDHLPLERLVVALRATFAGDLPRLRQDYRLVFRSDGAVWNLDLRPRERPLVVLFERIEIAGKGVDIERIAIEESGGDRRSLRTRILSRRPAGLP